jgi:SAM-dependent methyltransferase
MDYKKIYNQDYFGGKNSFFYKLGYGNRLSGMFYFTNMFNQIGRHVKKIDNGKVLDVGCAYGLMLQKFPDSFKKFGVDISRHAINIARKKMPGAMLKVSGAEDRLPFEVTFDVILLNDILEHLEFPELALKNAYASLKRGGILYITTPNLNNVRKKIFKYADKKEHHVSMFSHSDFKGLLDSLGFGVIEDWTFINQFVYLKFKSNAGIVSAFVCKK